ncbi:hypothetical protein XELAEV_18025723mg [Xenopus laevis]|uniref:Sulfurtransferase n=1 Tax=Xenopus laevis TaxID=8355 RepID=A0A974D2V4_XENLA|nr:hypothetical protein XELAEV_18025723mg [Xenopus laevis]
MTHQLLPRALVSPRWLWDTLRNGSALSGTLRVLDASWHLPKSGRDGWREYKERHIPGSYFFDIDACSDRTSPYDHMLPTADQFSEYAGSLGISNDSHIVVYDASDFGSYSAPRVWWMFRIFGHPQVSVLDGGIEPGHISGAVNVPFPSFLSAEGYEKSLDEIRHLFHEKGVDLSKPMVATCGSGVTACHVALAAFLCGKEDVSIYDGSWVEWYMRAKPEDVISEGRGKTL